MALSDTTLRFAVLGALLALAGCANGIESYGDQPATGGANGQAGGGTGSGGSPSGGTGSSVGTGNGSGTGGRIGSDGSGGIRGTGGAIVGPPGSGGRTSVPVFSLPWTDDFEANTVNSPAVGWIKDPKDVVGQWAVAMDGTTKVLQELTSVSSISRIVGGDAAWTDMKVEVRVKFSTVSSSSLAVLGVRFVDFDNYYFAHLQGDGALKIRKRIAGSTTDLVTYKSNVPLVVGTWYTIGFTFQGTTVTLSYNGAAVGTMTELAASLPAGGIMLGVQTGAASFDDVKVTAP
jgi:hypothetical protein